MPKKRVAKAIWALSGVSGLLILSAPTSYAQDELPIVASAEAESDSGLKGTIDVHWAEQSEEGGYTSIAWSVGIDDGSDEFKVYELDNDLYRYSGEDASGVTLLDEDSEIRYHPIQDSEERCVCAGNFTSSDFIARVSSGGYSIFWTTYLLEEGTSTVTLEIEGFNPVEDIPVE